MPFMFKTHTLPFLVCFIVTSLSASSNAYTTSAAAAAAAFVTVAAFTGSRAGIKFSDGDFEDFVLALQGPHV